MKIVSSLHGFVNLLHQHVGLLLANYLKFVLLQHLPDLGYVDLLLQLYLSLLEGSAQRRELEEEVSPYFAVLLHQRVIVLHEGVFFLLVNAECFHVWESH